MTQDAKPLAAEELADIRRRLQMPYGNRTANDTVRLLATIDQQAAEIGRLRSGLNSGAKEIDRILRLGREEAREWPDLALGFDDVRDGLVALAVTGEAAKEPQ